MPETSTVPVPKRIARHLDRRRLRRIRITYVRQFPESHSCRNCERNNADQFTRVAGDHGRSQNFVRAFFECGSLQILLLPHRPWRDPHRASAPSGSLPVYFFRAPPARTFRRVQFPDRYMCTTESSRRSIVIGRKTEHFESRYAPTLLRYARIYVPGKRLQPHRSANLKSAENRQSEFQTHPNISRQPPRDSSPQRWEPGRRQPGSRPQSR